MTPTICEESTLAIQRLIEGPSQLLIDLLAKINISFYDS